eukprot:gene10707-19483_t
MSKTKRQEVLMTSSLQEFEHQKFKSLSGIDNSKKGSIDQPIIDLVSFINNLNDFFTTSSCSGRIAVISEGDARKKGCNWLYMSHATSSQSDIVKAVKDSIDSATATFKYEAFVLHVQCKTLDKAQKMAVRSTHAMEVPLVLKGKLMVSEEYIANIVEICNEKLEENFKRIDR